VRTGFHILPLEPARFDEAWALRLRALREHPEAFGQPYDEMASLSPEAARTQFDTFWNYRDNRVFVAVAPNDDLAGMLGLARPYREKQRHRAHIWGVYVAPGYRGHKLSDALLDAAVSYARDTLGLLQVNLEVMAINGPARRAYERAGFVQHGIMARADILDGVALDSIQMVKMFDDFPALGQDRSPSPLTTSGKAPS